MNLATQSGAQRAVEDSMKTGRLICVVAILGFGLFAVSCVSPDDSPSSLDSDTDSDTSDDSPSSDTTDTASDNATDSDEFTANRKFAGPCVESVDWDDDGEDVPDNTPNQKTVYQYDELERLTEVDQRDADGTLLSRSTYTYSAEFSIQVLDEYSRDDNEVIRYRVIYTSDPSGNIVREEWDERADGIIESTTAREFDGSGNLVTEETLDADSAVVQRTMATYDENGNLLTQDIDGIASWPCDGVSDMQLTYLYTFNEAHQVLEQEEIRSLDGNVSSSLTRYTYDHSGNVLSVVFESSEGDADTSQFFTYDQEGYVLTSEFQNDGGAVIHCYFYDEFHNLTLMSRNSTNDDAEIDEYYTYSYGCWDR